MKKLFPLLALPLLLATGCEQTKQAREGFSNLSKLGEAGKQLEANMEANKTRRAEREQHGDTLALPYQTLEAYLPAEVSGYEAQAPSGEATKTGTLSFSTAERKFTKGSDEVEVKLVDYNGANELFQGATVMFGLGLEHEDDDNQMRSAPLKLDGVKGMENRDKKSGKTDLTLVVGDRFIVTVAANNQPDFTLVESVAQRLDLAKLAKL